MGRCTTVRRMRRLTVWVALVIAVVLPAGPASAADTPGPSSTPTTSISPTPERTADPTPSDGIRELPTADDGADFYSVATILIFFAIAMGIFVFIIRAGMRAADRED